MSAVSVPHAAHPPHPNLWQILRGQIAPRPVLAVIAVLFATLATSYFTRFFTLALADLRGVWGLSYDEGNTLSTIANALQLITAPAIPALVVIYGPRRVLLYPATLMFFICIGMPFAKNPSVIFTLHALLSLILGCFVPATLATIFQSIHPRYWLIALSFYTVRLTVALHSGIFITGEYVEHIGWQNIYWQGAVSALIIALLVTVSLPLKDVNVPYRNNLDKGGAVMFCTALTLIFAGLNEGNHLDWFESKEITVWLGGGLLMFAAFLFWQKFAPNPFAHPRVILRRNVFWPMLMGLFYSFVSFGTAFLIPNYLGVVGHLKSVQTADVFYWLLGAQFVLVPISIWIIQRVDARLTLAFGFLCMTMGCWIGTGITADWRIDDFIPMTFLFAVGNAFGFLSVMAISVANSNPPEIISVLAYVQIPRVVGPTFTTAVLSTFISKSEQIHSALLVPYIDRGREIVQKTVEMQGMDAVAYLVHREAYVLAFKDAYSFCFLMGVISLFIILIIRPAPPNPLMPYAYK